MKDLDFDEIDRAVNSLITGNGSPSDDKPVIQSTDSPINTPVAADVTARSAQQPLAARRSSGRFMDVVHPSSDMRTTPPVSPRSVSREGVRVAPSMDVNPDELNSTNQRESRPTTNFQPKPFEAPKPEAGDWPDPIDFNSSTQDSTSAIPADPIIVEPEQVSQPQSIGDDDKDINQIADAINKTLGQNQDLQAPLESPFLTDAKVNKRPLGAFSAEASVPPTDLTPVVDTLSSPAESEIPTPADGDDLKQDETPIETDTPLPAELQDDLLLIESGVDTDSQTKKDNLPSPTKPPQAEVPIGPISITQQYKEQPSTGDQPTGAIFDTEAYHKPLAHPAKNKSGWLWVFWIVGLLAVGAGAGAAVYFYILPLL
ncbi:hypothetical protein H7X68_01535 [Candidatus Saccharibacteria bacterium]|nr:hypothetical protein [Candidatus Saccharibacteria bacterium]